MKKLGYALLLSLGIIAAAAPAPAAPGYCNCYTCLNYPDTACTRPETTVVVSCRDYYSRFCF